MIKGISGSLPETFKLKTGGKGTEKTSRGGQKFRLPVKWNYMKICKPERNTQGDFIIDEKLTMEMGGSAEPTVIGPIVFLYNDPDLILWTAYRWYKGRVCVCRGNGETAQRLQANGKREGMECTCEMLGKKGGCKPNGILSFVLPTAELGGVCKYRTTSWNSIRSLAGGLAYMRQLTGGNLRGIPFFLRLNQKDAEVEGQMQKIPFLTIEYHGNIQEIRREAITHAQAEAKQLAIVESIEIEARRQMATDAQITDADDEDAAEFNPTEKQKEDGSVVSTETGEMIAAPEKEERVAHFPMGGANAEEAEGETREEGQGTEELPKDEAEAGGEGGETEEAKAEGGDLFPEDEEEGLI